MITYPVLFSPISQDGKAVVLSKSLVSLGQVWLIYRIRLADISAQWGSYYNNDKDKNIKYLSQKRFYLLKMDIHLHTGGLGCLVVGSLR